MKYKITIIILTFCFLIFNVTKAHASETANIIFSPQSKISVGRDLQVNVYVDSNILVNAVQLSIMYPTDQFKFKKISYERTRFTIQAEEKITTGNIIISRGNLTAIKGKNLLASLTLVPQKQSASTNNLTFKKNDSLVMSKDNVNILSGSQVLTTKPYSATTNSSNKGVVNLLKQSVNEFINGLFGK